MMDVLFGIAAVFPLSVVQRFFIWFAAIVCVIVEVGHIELKLESTVSCTICDGQSKLHLTCGSWLFGFVLGFRQYSSSVRGTTIPSLSASTLACNACFLKHSPISLMIQKALWVTKVTGLCWDIRYHAHLNHAIVGTLRWHQRWPARMCWVHWARRLHWVRWCGHSGSDSNARMAVHHSVGRLLADARSRCKDRRSRRHLDARLLWWIWCLAVNMDSRVGTSWAPEKAENFIRHRFIFVSIFQCKHVFGKSSVFFLFCVSSEGFVASTKRANKENPPEDKEQRETRFVSMFLIRPPTARK